MSSTSAKTTASTSRCTDLIGEHLFRLPAFEEYTNQKEVRIADAIEQLSTVMPSIKKLAEDADHNVKVNGTESDLSDDQKVAVMLYTAEFGDDSFYQRINKELRSKTRSNETLRPFFPIMKLIETGLSKLPETGKIQVYRGVKADLREKYKRLQKIIWWGFSSCTKCPAVVRRPEFLGKPPTKRILFIITTDSGRSLRGFTLFEDEEEILLLPGREFKIISCTDEVEGLTEITLEEIKPEIMLPGEPVRLSYDNITVADLPRIFDDARERRCTELDLASCRLGDEGAKKISQLLSTIKVSHLNIRHVLMS